MFERFTERARQVVVLAQDESRALRHNYIGTEHLLLGVLREKEGIAARVLRSLGVTVEETRALVLQTIGEGEEHAATGQIPFTPRAKRALDLSLREALSLGHDYIGTEHILLGLVRETDGVAARILDSFGADAELVREEVLGALSGGTPSPRTLDRRPLVLERLDEQSEADGGRQLVLPLAVALASFPLGVLVGWLIWG